MKRVSRGIDRIQVTFDDEHLVANAGLLLVATLTTRLGIEELIDATVRLVGRIGGALPGRKVLTLVHAIVAGGSHIDHADVLRAGATQAVLGHRVMAPSTLGTFLRASPSAMSASSRRWWARCCLEPGPQAPARAAIGWWYVPDRHRGAMPLPNGATARNPQQNAVTEGRSVDRGS